VPERESQLWILNKTRYSLPVSLLMLTYCSRFEKQKYPLFMRYKTRYSLPVSLLMLTYCSRLKKTKIFSFHKDSKTFLNFLYCCLLFCVVIRIFYCY
jgi:hypothetical protein